MSLTAEETLERLTLKAANLLGWKRVPANCYDGSQEAWVQEKDGAELMIGSVRLYNPVEELIHRFKHLSA